MAANGLHAMALPPNTLVLVADGRKMLFLRNQGEDGHIDLVTEAHRARTDRKDSEMKSDAPGVMGQSAGHGRPSIEETDYHQLEEDRFASEAAEQLKHRALGGDFDSLAIIAPPKTLGELRKHLHSEVENRIVLELPKEMTNRPLPDIAAMLMGRSEPPETDRQD
jgi:protein required for attachment to host cells